METFKQYFKWPLIIAVLFIGIGYFIGGPKAAFIVGVLGVLETSLSFDNAVVNATVLRNMDEKWRKYFLVFGMFIAVVGMRVLFPLLIVCVVASMNIKEVFFMAKDHPDVYAATLTSAHHQIAAFGGAFLMMVFLKFLFDKEKDEHWIHIIEAPLAKLGRLDMVQIAVTSVAVLITAKAMPDLKHSFEFVVAGVAGLITYIVADGIGALLGGEDAEGGNAGAAVAKQGFAAFMYLELLDASFSFDGVIGAFALTTNLAIIGMGLAVGALFVREMTLLLVDRGTLDSYRYLEHGAYWAIGALATMMFVGVNHEIPEWVTGLMGALFISVALASSIHHNRRDAKLAQA